MSSTTTSHRAPPARAACAKRRVCRRVLESIDVPSRRCACRSRASSPGDEVASGQIPFTPRSKKVLDWRYAKRSLGHNYIGTSTSCSGWCARTKASLVDPADFDADAEKVRNAIIDARRPGRARWCHRRFPARAGRRRHAASWEYRSSLAGRGVDAAASDWSHVGSDGWQLASRAGHVLRMGLQRHAGVSSVDATCLAVAATSAQRRSVEAASPTRAGALEASCRSCGASPTRSRVRGRSRAEQGVSGV